MLIFDIQRFSLHDGAGIRTTAFFKGCPLRCLWCHNPEGQTFEPSLLRRPERCVGCGHCEEGCPTGAREVVGEAYTVDKLCETLLRDRPFYERSGGGVTLSGGEVMAQDMDEVCAVGAYLKGKGISIHIDTCGHAPYAHFARALPFVDTFLYDVKAADPALHARVTGVSNELILDNLARLAVDGARLHLRVPVVPGVNDGDEALAIIEACRARAPGRTVSLLPYHKLGGDKRARLGMPEAEIYREPTQSEMETLARRWRDAGFDARIGG